MCVCVCVCVCVCGSENSFHLEVEVAIMKIVLEGKKDLKKCGIYLPTKSPRLTNEELIIIQEKLKKKQKLYSSPWLVFEPIVEN